MTDYDPGWHTRGHGGTRGCRGAPGAPGGSRLPPAPKREIKQQNNGPKSWFKGYSWRDPLCRFGMTPLVEVGPETTIWLVDPYCWSTNLLMCMGESHRKICCFSCFESLICWFWSILESTFCTLDPFCWQHDVTLSPFVDSGLSSNQHSVQWTHFVDTIMSVIILQYICEKGGQQIETRQSKFLFSDRQDISW